jgi:tetratricopeptide (TPR) repeat protein
MEEALVRYVDLLVDESGLRGTGSNSKPLSDLLANPGNRYVLTGEAGSGKTIALLKLASEAAQRARDEENFPLPLFCKLNLFDATRNGLRRLMVLVAQGAAADPDDLTKLWREGRRPFLFLLDGFNETARDYRPGCLAAIQELLSISRHSVIISSRPDPLLDSLKNIGVKAADIVELNDERIRRFLATHGAAELYDRLEGSLKDLGRNPFMLWALAQSCADLPPGGLPRNQGELYRNFIEHYIYEVRENRKIPAPTRYNFQLVKKPVLGEIALAMTRQGVTRYTDDLAHLKEIGAALQRLRSEYEGLVEIREHECMPDAPAARTLLDEVVSNGILRRTSGSLEFSHQSIQDWFTATALAEVPLADIAAEVPEAEWASGEIRPSKTREAALSGALVMLAGLRSDGHELAGHLVTKDITLAAACFSAVAGEDKQGVRTRLITVCLEFLHSKEPTEQYIGCKAAQAARLHEAEVITAISRLVLSDAQGVAIEAVLYFRQIEPERKTGILLHALANTRYASVRMAATGVLQDKEPQDDFHLTISLAVLQDKRSDFEYHNADVVRPSRVLREAVELYGSNTTTDELMESALRQQDPSPAVILLRFLHAQEAEEKLTAMARSDENPSRLSAIALLPMVSRSSTVIETLKDLLEQPAVYPGVAGRAGIALASAVMQKLRLRADLLQLLRERVTDENVIPAARAGYALALFHCDSAEGRDYLATLLLKRDEPTAFRATFCSYAPTPLWAPWMFHIEDKSAKEGFLVELFASLVRSDPSPYVREAAAFALSSVPEGLIQLAVIFDDTRQSPAARGAAALAFGKARCEAAIAAISIPDPKNTEWNLLVSATIARMYTMNDEQRQGFLPGLLKATGGIRADDSTAEHDKLIIHALDALYSGAPETILAALRDGVREPASSEEREGAAIALALLDSPEATSVLTALSADTGNRLAAAAAHFGLGIAHYVRQHVQLPAGTPRLILRIIAYATAGEFEHTLADCDSVIGSVPDLVDVRQMRCLCLKELQRLPEALEEGLAAIRIAPADVGTHLMVARLYLDLDRANDAVSSYREAVRLDPNNDEILQALGSAAYSCGAWDEAVSAYRARLKLRPEDPEAYFDLGVALLASGEEVEAVVRYASGIEAAMRLPKDAGQEVYEGATANLDELAQKMPECAPAVTNIKAMLQRVPGRSEGFSGGMGA